MRRIGGHGGLGFVLVAAGPLALLAGYPASRGQASPTPVWTFIGPEPMLNEAPYFGGLMVPVAVLTPTAVSTPAAGSYNATGRVTSMAFDPASSEIFVGTANGGLWKSLDLGATFQPVAIQAARVAFGTQAIGAIALNTGTTPSTLFVGTGEANNSADSYYGQGLFRSTDLGNSWTALNYPLFAGPFAKLAINPGATATVFAAAGLGFTAGRADPDFQRQSAQSTGGLYRSTDGGSMWKHYTVSAFAIGTTGSATFMCHVPGIDNAPCPADDVAIDPNNPRNVYVAIQNSDVFASTDGGGTFTAACFSNNMPCSVPGGVGRVGRESLTVGAPAPGAPLACSGATRPCGTLYAMLGAPDGIEYTAFYKSTDGGVTWTPESVPAFTNPLSHITIDGTSPANLSLSSYDQALFLDPLDATGQKVFFGGVGLYESTSSGASWSFIAANGGTHSGQHALAFNSVDGNTLYLGNDGGAFKFALSGISSGVASFSSMSNTIAAGQIQSIAPHPTNNNVALAGFQGNGVQMYTGSTTPLGWTIADAADGATLDGGFTLFDHSNPNLAYHAFSTTIAGPLLSRSTNGGVSWDSADPTASIRQIAGVSRDPGAGLFPPLANDPAVAGRVLFGAHFIYASTDGMLTWQRQESNDLTGGCSNGTCALQDLEIARSDNSRAWALSISSNSNGPVNPVTAAFTTSYLVPFATAFRLFNTSQANLNSGAVWNNVTSRLPFNPANTQATGIAIDPSRASTAYLTLSGSRAMTGVNHAYRTTDFGVSWSALDGPFGGINSLPDVPALRMLVERSDITGGSLFLATDIGVFRSTDIGATWSPFNQGTLPPVPVFDIEENDNNLIFIGTHGRGAYTMQAPIPGPASLTVNPTAISFGNSLVFGSVGAVAFPHVVSVTDPRNSTQERPVVMTGAAQISGEPDFTFQSNGCPGGQLLPPNAACSVKVQFQPTASGPRFANLTFFDSASNSPQTVALSGTGVQGKVSISPSALNFSARPVGTTSQPQTVTVSNFNPISMGIQGIGIVSANSPDFSFTTTCGVSFPVRLGADQRCWVKVAFSPTATGARSAILELIDDAVGSPQAVTLSGTGK